MSPSRCSILLGYQNDTPTLVDKIITLESDKIFQQRQKPLLHRVATGVHEAGVCGRPQRNAMEANVTAIGFLAFLRRHRQVPRA